jgi:ferrous iron transport protein A
MGVSIMSLNDVELGKEYIIKSVDIGDDEELQSFLFSLGCYSGESITVVDKKKILSFQLRMQDIILIRNLRD